MSILSDIIGPAADFLGPVADFFGGERQQDYSRQNQEYATNASIAEAQRNREFQQYMSSHAYQIATADLQAAGLNPMLASLKGGATTPSGGQGTSPGPAGPQYRLGESLALNRQASTASALADAEIRRKDAETENINADTQVKLGQPALQTANVDKIRQDIQESAKRIDELDSRMKVQASTAAELDARKNLLIEQLPQVRATIDHLQSMVRMNDAQITRWAEQNKLTEQEVKEAIQRVRQDLPDIQAWLHRIEFDTKRAEFGAKQEEWRIRGESPTAWFSALLKAFNPLQGIFGGINK